MPQPTCESWLGFSQSEKLLALLNIVSPHPPVKADGVFNQKPI